VLKENLSKRDDFDARQRLDLLFKSAFQGEYIPNVSVVSGSDTKVFHNLKKPYTDIILCSSQNAISLWINPVNDFKDKYILLQASSGSLTGTCSLLIF